GNGVNDLIAYADIHGTDRPERYEHLQYGGVFCLEGSNGVLLWAKEYNGPVRNVFPIMDYNGDGVAECFVSKASIGPNWTIRDNRYEPDYKLNLYTNQMIYGNNGTDIPISTGDKLNFTNYFVIDLISLDDLTDSREDLILLEGEEYEVIDGNHTYIQYNCSLNTYFINGTKKLSINEVYDGWVHSDLSIPSLELFQYTDQNQLLFLNRDSLYLYNLSSENFLNEIYNTTFIPVIEEYEIIEDLNLDGVPEIVTISWDGNLTLLNGIDGGEIYRFGIAPELREIQLKEIHNGIDDGITYVYLEYRDRNEIEDIETKFMEIYSLELASHELIWELVKQAADRVEEEIFILEEDIDGDSVNELIYYERFRPFVSFGDVNRYRIINFISGEQYAIINTEFSGDTLITINDFDGDGRRDFVIAGDDRIAAISSRKPIGIWLSPLFPLGLPLFIILCVLLGAGVIIIILRGKRLQYRRKAVKEYKLTIVVNALAIGLMSLTFLLFLILMNVFNNTLIIGTNNANIVMAFIIVTIIWYGALPLTAALFNRFAPQFAYVFIKLRDLFFKVSKGYNHEILILDMKDRKEIGIVIQLKRLILPLLLSIAVGFYSYDALTSLLNYPKTFDVFGSTEFFNFMMGYMMFCILPMILSFLLFAFLISGNYLLDDAGVVYYRENKKYRQPGDIEPISIWAQSIIKGIAGLSALITFGAFIGSVDFSGFFGEGGDFLNLLFGFLVVIVMFVGIPFLTGFSYILLAGEVMELNAEQNIQKLYKIMEKNGYDTSPHDIKNIYLSGYNNSKTKTQEKIEEKDKTI
ncbi:MAG: hypothetical protein ACFFG0_39035, partial [Candidatus Thorarchaeota archaeon]